jgi:hypothetical protein
MDTLIPVLKNTFGDPELCKSFNQGRTNTSGIIRHVIAPVERGVLSCELEEAHISLIVDESTYKSWQKVFVLLAKYRDSKDIVREDFMGLLPEVSNTWTFRKSRNNFVKFDGDYL